MWNNLIVFPKSGVRARRRLAPIYGKEFSKPFGYEFKPIYHNWTYSMSPEGILKMIAILDQGGAKDYLQGGLMDEKAMKLFKFPFTPQQGSRVGVDYDKEFVENILPRLDAGLKEMSILGSIQFLAILLVLGANLGFNTKFFYYIVSNILTTEATSYVWQNSLDSEVSGNSIFGYTNYTMCSFLWWKKGFAKSSWLLTIATLTGLIDFGLQFSIPAASKILHAWGILVGIMWAKYGYGLI